MDTLAEIHSLSARRQAIWAGAEGYQGEPDSIAKKLGQLYETLRSERAQFTGRTRQQITRRARVESELERLLNR